MTFVISSAPARPQHAIDHDHRRQTGVESPYWSIVEGDSMRARIVALLIGVLLVAQLVLPATEASADPSSWKSAPFNLSIS